MFRFLILLSLFLTSILLFAQQEYKVEFEPKLYYRYSTAEIHVGGLGINVEGKVIDNFHIAGSIIGESSEKLSAGVQLKYCLPYKRGNWAFSNISSYYNNMEYQIHQLATQLAAGWEMDYFNAMLGWHFKWSGVYNGISNSGATVFEAKNFSYSIGAELRKRSSDWNIGVSVSNYEEIFIDTWNSPYITLYGRYELNKRTTINMRVGTQIAGFGNMAIEFYSAYVNVGTAIKF